MLRRIQVV